MILKIYVLRVMYVIQHHSDAHYKITYVSCKNNQTCGTL